MDLLLPSGPLAMASLLTGYRPDVLLVSGFNWRLPDEVLNLPRVAALNIHPSPLPRYRGPSPILHAIRNGDPYLGMTIHRMTRRLDAGPVLAQVTDIPIPENPTRDSIWESQKRALPGLIATALDRAVAGDPGTPQDEATMTYAGAPPPEWSAVTWGHPRRDVHNQLRLLRYLKRQAPEVTYQGQNLRAERSSLIPIPSAYRVECADGPLWVQFTRRA
ncbi:MAG: methionyl-tRNA formyltransferase [Nocardiopsaceae bacterium]|nr:methionyl-tRNA formyltransferase [Nocardiopsaceae bacterium]